jgi:hypothetical protein
MATEDFSAWGSFSLGFNTGRSATQPATGEAGTLDYLGVLDGGQLDTGVLKASLPIALYLLELQGLKVNLEAQLQVTLGLNLPPLPALAAAFDVSIPDLFANLLTVKTDFTLELQGLNAQLQLLLDLTTELGLMISGGGLSVWSYSGPAGALGQDLRSVLAAGLPGGTGPNTPAYGLVVACELPAVWSTFGLIFGPA